MRHRFLLEAEQRQRRVHRARLQQRGQSGEERYRLLSAGVAAVHGAHWNRA